MNLIHGLHGDAVFRVHMLAFPPEELVGHPPPRSFDIFYDSSSLILSIDEVGDIVAYECALDVKGVTHLHV